VEKHEEKGTKDENKEKDPCCFEQESFFPFDKESLETHVEESKRQEKSAKTQYLKESIREICPCPSGVIVDFLGGARGTGPACIRPGGVPGIIAD